VLHSAQDPEGHLRAAIGLLAPAVRLPQRVLQQAIGQVIGRPVSPEEELAKAVRECRPALQAIGRPPLTVVRTAEVLHIALDSLAHVRSSSEGIAEEETTVAGCLADLFTAVNTNSRDAEVLITLLKGDGPISRGFIVEALGHAFALTRPPSSSGVPAEARSFGSLEAKRTYTMAFRKVVPQAFGCIGGSSEKLIEALMEDVTPAQLLSRCRLSAGTPVLPMEAMQMSDVGDAVLRLADLDVAVELCYTGQRVQIHRFGNHVAIFDRNQKDLGASFGEEQLAALRAALASEACVLDAVAVCSDDVGSGELCFMVFDCLFLDGCALSRKSLSGRHEALRRTVLPCEFLQVAPQERFSAERPLEAAEVEALLVEAKAASCPGLVLKSLVGTYEAGLVAESWVVLSMAHL